MRLAHQSHTLWELERTFMNLKKVIVSSLILLSQAVFATPAVENEGKIFAEPIYVKKIYSLSSIDSEEVSNIFKFWRQSEYEGISNAYKVTLNGVTIAIAGSYKMENGMLKAACFKRNGMALFDKGVEGTDLDSIKRVLTDRCLSGVD